MKRFIRSRESVVRDAVDGFLASSAGQGTTRLDAYPDIKVVLRDDWRKERVALVSGGGSGHEPAHAAFVGEGMLTAAVCGEIFASPSVDAVLAAILAVTGEAGCLLIVKNYTGDRLNFGLAAEMARARGLKVEMVIVGDDISLPANPQPRGIAGTVFVHKLAGACAAEGAPLETVLQVARQVIARTRSIGLSLTSCHLIGVDTQERIGAEDIELGLGIHGEPGAETRPFADADTLLGLMTERLLAEPDGEEGRHALLVNDLGTSGPLEMNILMRCIADSPLAGAIDRIVGPAPMMTALDMHGLSLSLLKLDDRLLSLLEAPAAPSAWPRPTPFPPRHRLVALPAELVPTPAEPSEDATVRALLQTILAALQDNETEMDALDARVGDGDAGSTFALAARAVEAEMQALPFADGAALFRALADKLMRVAGGSSGVLLATLCAAAATEFAASGDWARAFGAGVARIGENGGAKPGDRTMLDALVPAADRLIAGGTLAQAAAAARAGADATAGMQRASAGRSAYLSGRDLTGNPDPGAEMVARAFEAVARTHTDR